MAARCEEALERRRVFLVESQTAGLDPSPASPESLTLTTTPPPGVQARSTAFRGGEGDGSFAFGSETLEMVVTLYVPPGAAAGEADSKKF